MCVFSNTEAANVLSANLNGQYLWQPGTGACLQIPRRPVLAVFSGTARAS